MLFSERSFLLSPERTDTHRHRRKEKKVVVVNLLLHRGHCNSFSHTIPPLQAAPSFACSVASLSRFPDHQLPGCSHLRERILADCLLGWGAASAQSAGHAQLQTTPSPKPERNRGNPHMTFRGHLKCTHFKILRRDVILISKMMGGFLNSCRP